MGLSREEVEKIAQASAQRVLEGLNRYAVNYKEPKTIEEGLQDSMVEESTAANWYLRRGMDARLKGDEVTADLYEHVANEEDHHYQEFKERVGILASAEVDTPITPKITEKEARYGFLQLNEAEYSEALKSGRYPDPTRYEKLTAFHTEPHEANWKGLSLAEMFPTKYKDLLERGVPDKLSPLEVKTVIEEKRIPYGRGVELGISEVTPEVTQVEAGRLEAEQSLEHANKRIGELRESLKLRTLKRETRIWQNNELARYNEWKAAYERLLRENDPTELIKYAPKELPLSIPKAEAGIIK